MKFSRELSILNVMEPIVSDLFDNNYVKTGALKCDCEKCQIDIILLTLNHLPPHYTSSQTGEAFIKASYLNSQLQSDVLREITEAVKIIENNPNH
ncbi:late competence development ComFB family protein [Cohnella silvisoli]|uniref:Late competence development ComFB family protein n=1 Tax=Cohnella silvisoli TaxID=2873699 RepID=A0ABV1KZW4_9BACL|nr:late competence development ComFB family protein [Cohnella silvisoli]MCD9024966.1 late competence development ComFB family protein [Cohnella silvisoli]